MRARTTIRKRALESRLEREIEQRLELNEITETARPIIVTLLRELDGDGCNWTVDFVQGGEVTPYIVAAINHLKAQYNIGESGR